MSQTTEHPPEHSSEHSTQHSFSPVQQRIAAAAWLTYAFYYLGRLNLSPALAPLATSLNVSLAEVGLLGSVFFWAYGAGQMFGGELGNHFRPRTLVSVGLIVCAVTNILFSFQHSLLLMAILWAINGFAQSTGWGPLVRLLGEYLSVQQRMRFSTWFAMSFQVGAAVAWAVAGWLITFGWQEAFRVPGIILLVIAALWLLLGKGGRASGPVTRPAIKLSEVKLELRLLWPVLTASAFIGFAQVGSNIWFPTYIRDTHLFPESLIGLAAGLLPLLSIFGTLFAGRILHRRGHAASAMSLVLITSFIPLIIGGLLPLVPQFVVVMIALILMGGVTAILNTSLPMMLAREGRLASVATFISGASNLGGGLAGGLVGVLIHASGWSVVFVIWGICLLIAAVLTRRIRHPQHHSA